MSRRNSSVCAVLAVLSLMTGAGCPNTLVPIPGVNEPPVAHDMSLSTMVNVPLNITLDASDSNGTALKITILSLPNHGLLTGIGVTRTYTPQADFLGTDSFTYLADDGKLESNTATVTISVQPPPEPSISFTKVPLLGSFQKLEGTTNVDPATYAVVVYIKVGSTWWVKPLTNQPLTSIKSDGSWTCSITTGGIDETATEIRAYVVLKTWTFSGTNTLPNAADYVASASATR